MTKSGTIIMVIHVDNFLIAGSSHGACEPFKTQLCTLWSISDLGDATFCVGIGISCNWNGHTISLSQTALLNKILSTFSQSNTYPISTSMDHTLQL